MKEMDVAKHAVPLRMKSVCLLALSVLALSGCGSSKATTAPTTSNKIATAPTTSSKIATVAPTSSIPAATSGAPTATSSPSPRRVPSRTAGSTVVTDDAKGFSVRLPAGYTRIKDKAQLRTMLKSASLNPNLKALVDRYAREVDKARVFAVKIGPDGSAHTIYVSVNPTGGGITTPEQIGEIYNIVAPGMEAKLGFTITGHRVVNVAGTRALRIEFLGRMANAQMRFTQVYLIHNGSLVTLRTSQPDVPASTAEANTIIDGLRLY